MLAPSPAATESHGDHPARRRTGGRPGRWGSPDVPDRLRGLDHLAVAAEQHEPVERPGEPPVVGDRDHRPVERRSAPPRSASARGQVEVVGRLVEQQQRRPGQLQQQHQEPGLLPAGEGAEALVALRRPARTGDSAAIASCRCSPARCSSPRQRISTSVLSDQLGPVVGLREVPGPHPGAEPGRPVVRDRGERRPVDRRVRRRPGRCRPGPAAAGSATCRCRWRRAPPPGRRTRSPGRTGRSGPSSSSCSQMTARLPVRPPRSRIRMSWSFGGSWRRPGLLELAQPGLRGLVPRGHARRCRPPSACTSAPARLQLLVLLVPAAAQLVEPLVPGHPGLVPGRRSRPGAPTRVPPSTATTRSAVWASSSRSCET